MTSPADTIAFIVAIEDYNLGEGWPLNGITAQASALIQMLYARGVRRFIVCSSPLAQNGGVLTALPPEMLPLVKTLTARRDDFGEALMQLLPEQADGLPDAADPAHAGCLLFFWIGHGNADL